MQATSIFINGTPQVFLVPIIGLVFILGLLAAWTVQLTYLASIGTL
jgi:hypothetical protein